MDVQKTTLQSRYFYLRAGKGAAPPFFRLMAAGFWTEHSSRTPGRQQVSRHSRYPLRTDRRDARELEEDMNVSLKKTAIAAVAALALGAGVAVSTTAPAEAGPVWHHGGYYGGHWRGGWWGPAIGLGIIGGVIAGAAVANSGPYYGPGPYYGDGCWQPRAMYDAWGRYIGQRMVNVCY
jgi:hypothetical protein